MLDKALFVGKNRTEFLNFYDDAEQFDNMLDGRIPALLALKKGKYAGTLIAVVDKASSGVDWGRIEIAMRRSLDNGESFAPMKTVLSLPVRKFPYSEEEYSSTFAIDPLLIETENGSIVMLVDFFPECKGLRSPQLLEHGSGYMEENGRRLKLLYSGKSALDSVFAQEGDVFTLREDGFVYNSKGVQTRYYIPKNHSAEYSYASLGDMYYRVGEKPQYITSPPPLIPEYSENADIYVGNVYLSKNKPEFAEDKPVFVQKKKVFDDSGKLLCVETGAAPLRAAVTSYIFMLKSDDGGKTFSQPKDITPYVKKKSDGSFLGVSPGTGIRLKSKKYAGRLLAPVYALGKAGALISDDGGESWRRGKSVYCENIDECRLLEVPDGRIFCFGRPPGGGKIPLSFSADGGETFKKLPECFPLIPQCQYSVISLPSDFILAENLINDGFYFLLSAPTGHGGQDASRTDGKVFLGKIENESVRLIKEYSVKDKNKYASFGKYDDFFAYSCLALLSNNKTGLLYEGYPSGYISFTSFAL